MTVVRIKVQSFVVNRQVIERGRGEDEMYGTVKFDVVADGALAEGCHSDVKLVVGGTYEVDAIEVGRPVGYKGPFDHGPFSRGIEAYVRGAVGTNGWAVRLGPDTRAAMLNCTFTRPSTFTFEATGDSGGW